MKYVMKPYVVDAVQWGDDNFHDFVGNDYSYFNCPGDGSITIKIGGVERSIKPGEWLVRVAPGEYRVMADAVFIREYHPFDISVFEEQIEKIVARKLRRVIGEDEDEW